MKLKRTISLLLCLLLVVGTVTVSMVTAGAEDVTEAPTEAVTEPTTEASEDEITNPYSIAAQALDKEFAYDGELGCFYTPETTTFKLWAPTSAEVKVNLYATGSDDEEGAADLGVYAMAKVMDGDKWTGVWSVDIKGDLKNVYYTYTSTTTALVTEKENTATFVDPYAKATGVNGDRAMVVDLDSTDPEGWDKDAHIYVDEQTDAIVWEVVVRDFSASETSGVSEANRGKYLAFTESGTTVNGEGMIPTCVDYLKELGITHVQINPFYDFATVNEAKDLADQYNWGYDPENYNVPEGSYSSNPYDGNVRINECKQMIQALHEAGIGVIMDVVYNHTYFTDTSNFQLAVPNYYYRFNEAGGWSNASGCANDTASERAMYRKFMIDSCRYWAEEYHVDGFRFDLMGIHDVETMNLIREDLDKIDSRIIMYGEGWSAASSVFDKTTCTGEKTVSASQKNAKVLSERVALFNDEIRDGIKGNVFSDAGSGYVQGNISCYRNIAYGIRANTVGKGCTWSAVAPSQCVTYASCHDNHALYDRLVTSIYGFDAEYRQRYSDLIEMNKMSAAIITTSQGICFYLAGEEMARTKDGDTNSYKSPIEENMIDWELVVSNADLVSYYRGLMDIRKAFSPFTAATKDYSTKYTLNNAPASMVDTLGYTLENDTEGEWKKIAVLANSSRTETKEITLVDDSVSEWVVIADNTSAGVDALYEVKGSTFTVAPSSAVIAVDKESFDAVGLESGDSKVVVNHVNKDTGEVLTRQVITGKVGNGYETSADSSLALEYDFIETEGEAKGVITEGVTTVTYKYELYKAPRLVTGDVNGDGKVNISDATSIQKHIAYLITLDEEHLLENGDYDYTGSINIKDATMLQKHLAGFSVSIATVTTNFYAVKEDGTTASIAAPVVKTYRVGTEYETEAIKVELYEVSSKLPENAKGIVAAGNTNVDYYYDYSASGYKIHAAHLNAEETWTPYLWAWSTSGGNAFKSWPGVAMMDDGDGWFSVNAALPEGEAYSLIISNNGSPQSADYTGVEGEEIWIVIDDYNLVNMGKYLTIYTEKPDLEALRAELATEAPTDAPVEE
ncbi:MAG: type I pullulanase [Ruminococcus sp.]|nr:type I pullulanase [Ruminococcus sp.]